MFTVCPKCALTLVVTAADLRIAQGYVRCGRCSNVFNAIVGLSEDRSGGSGTQPGTASTSIIRKAPSITEDDATRELLTDTGETEAIYAEPEGDSQEPSFQDVFVEAPEPAPASTPNAPPPQGPMPEFTDSIPDVALEFNPEATDVSQVFIESAPAKKIDLRQVTGTFEQIRPPAQSPPVPAPRQAVPRQPAPPPPPQRRDPEDVELEDELRSLAARLDATGKQPALRSEPARQPAAPKPARPAAPRREDSEDVLVYRGSPYNSADEPASLARKAAASAARRRLEPPPPPVSERSVLRDDAEFDAPPADNAGAYAAAAALTPQRAPRGRRLAWLSGAAALGVVLAAQAIHHKRHDLATHATLNRPLTRFYAAIGVPLVPRWDLSLYEVRQLGAFSGASDSGNLTVRASLKSAADQPLPLPLLRITVQDRYGNRIATRDVPPKDYVPGAVPANAHLGVGQRIDAEMSFKDPGRDAVGFEIDACLSTPEGRIACANDAALAAR
jgi:predicted Zn finger-like uncharacterized protein